jgi:hypothetical protein
VNQQLKSFHGFDSGLIDWLTSERAEKNETRVSFLVLEEMGEEWRRRHVGEAGGIIAGGTGALVATPRGHAVAVGILSRDAG